MGMVNSRSVVEMPALHKRYWLFFSDLLKSFKALAGEENVKSSTKGVCMVALWSYSFFPLCCSVFSKLTTMNTYTFLIEKQVNVNILKDSV